MADRRILRFLPRRLLLAAVGVGAVVVLVVLAPTLVSWGLGDGFVRRAIEKRVNGAVRFTKLGLSWSGPQTVRELVITDDRGVRAVEIDASIDAGLLALLFDGAASLEIGVAGVARGDRRAAGSTTFVSRRRPRVEAGPARLARPLLSLTVDGLQIEMNDEVSGELLVLTDLRGEVLYAPGEEVRLDLASPTTSAGRSGSIRVAGDVAGLFDAGGNLTLADASGSLDVELVEVMLPRAARPTFITAAHLHVGSEDLRQKVDLTVSADIIYDDQTPGRLAGTIVALEPVGADGQLQLGLERISGEITGSAVPTALAQPFLKNTPVLLTRDVGPTLDVEARLTAGGQKAPIEVAVKGEQAELFVSGTIDYKHSVVEIHRVHAAAQVAPGLVEAATGGVGLDERAQVILWMTNLDFSAADDLRVAFRQAAINGTITLGAPVSLAREGRSLAKVEALHVAFVTRNLGDLLRVGGRAVIDGSEAIYKTELEELFARPFNLGRGKLSVAGLAPATVRNLIPANPRLAEAALTDPLDLEIATVPGNRGYQVQLTVQTTGTDLLVSTLLKEDGVLEVTKLAGNVLVQPDLFAALLAGTGSPLALERPAAVMFRGERIDLGEWRPVAGMPAQFSLEGTISADNVVVERVPGLVEPLDLAGFTARVTARRASPLAWSVDGRARLHKAADAGRLGILDFRVVGTTEDGGEFDVEQLDVRDISVATLESMAGYESGSLVTWIGEEGAAAFDIERNDEGGYRGTIQAEFEQFTGDVEIVVDEQAVEVSVKKPRLVIQGRHLQARLAASAAAQANVAVESDMPVAVKVNALRLPRALFAGGSLDSAAAAIDVRLAGSGLVLNTPGYGRSTLDELIVAARTTDLAEGVSLQLKGTITPPQPGAAAGLMVDCRVGGLVHEGVLDPARATLELVGEGRQVPTALLDAVGSFKGLLVAAVGPVMDLDVRAQEFSGASGILEGRLESANGWLEGELQGGEGAIQVRPKKPLRAELVITRDLTQRLLARLHPFLVDVRSVQQPLQAIVTSARIPLDGDITALDLDGEVFIGPVEFDSGALTLGFLAIADSSRGETLPGEIAPIKVRIRKGVATYDRFAARVHKVNMIWSGSVDLKSGAVNMRTEIPFKDLSLAIKELEGLENVSVPLTMTGTPGNLKYDVDPEFIAEAALQSGFNKLLEEASEEAGFPIGDLFKDLLKPR